MADEKITILEACKILHRSEKQVRRYVTTGRLPAEMSEDGKYYILKSDVERLGRHPDRLPEDKLSRRMTGLESRIDEIEKRLDSLSTHVDEIIEVLYSLSTPPTAQPPPTTRSEAAHTSEGHYRGKKQRSQKEALPDGYIASERFAKDHGIAPTTMRTALLSGRLQAEEKNWIVGRATVRIAFNHEQQWAFVMAYQANEHFHRCKNAECPCQM